MASTTVIIPNYNGIHFLRDCLLALSEQTCDDFCVCVVDNGSGDGSVEYLEKEWPKVKVIALPENTGFCHAVNLGVRWARTKYVLLLNNDTVPEKDFVGALVRAMNAHNEAFSCASCMLSAADPTVLDGAGDLYSALGWAFARGKDEKAERYRKETCVFSACAGAAIYRRKEFIELGMLDEEHFAYLEDMDLGWKARLAGMKNIYIPSARVIHVGSGTTGGRHSAFKVKMSARNNIYMIRKNMNGVQKVINAPFIAAGTLIKLAYFKRKGFAKEYREGLKEGRRLNAVPSECRSAKTRLAIQIELWGNLFRRRH